MSANLDLKPKNTQKIHIAKDKKSMA